MTSIFKITRWIFGARRFRTVDGWQIAKIRFPGCTMWIATRGPYTCSAWSLADVIMDVTRLSQ